jgi:NTP pyrophosphatase (non-canonical NTP hydrolase)
MNQKELTELIRHFCEERDWDQFHSIKDLSIGLSTESNELLQLFRFKDEKQCEEYLANNRKKVEDECADVYYYLLRLSDLYNIDLNQALENKMKDNHKKYPKELVKGKNLKYNEYE